MTDPVAEVSTPTVLYAPTWRGHVEETMLYSLPTGERIVAALLDRGATVIFRPHPFSYDFDERRRDHRAGSSQLLEADARRSGRQHLWGAAAESEIAASSTASTPPTRWSPTSPAWSRTTCSPASRSR